MPKFKVVISLGVHSTIVEAQDEQEAQQKAGDEMVRILEGMKPEDFVEVYEATEEDIAEYEKEKAVI
jgi:hypothetical protein